MKILVVDDDRELRDLIAFALRQAGYLVITAEDAPQGLAAFQAERPDLVILDVNLPQGQSGFDVCREIRTKSAVPIMMLTVRGSEEDQVRGLDLGADDYLTKPFSPRTLTARVRAHLRRSGTEASARAEAGDLALDLQMQTLAVAGRAPVRLTSLESRLAHFLLANAGTPVSNDRLFRHVWGFRGRGDQQALKQLVRRVRQKLEPDPSAPRYLLNLPGAGYVLHVTPQTPQGDTREEPVDV